MNCPACGHENREAAKFCEECGERFAKRCASCASELRAGAKFCDECGMPIDRGETSSPPDRTPRDYTPKHLADKILRSKSTLEGELKQVTVLFADVKGSLELAEQVDPEEWHQILDRFFQILADGVHRFEGTVNQYTGDGIMALFGAPIAHEDHAQRACYAALHLSDQLRTYARELRREQGLDFSTRIGLNSGEVVVGKIGDDLRMDYTAQGQTVGVAARIQQLAEPGKVFVTGPTGELARGYFELEDLGAFNLKGVAEPVPVFELRGVGELRTRFDVSRARGLTRFVGRDDDLKTLEAALSHAREGAGQVVGVVGEAGVGKSRLCFEFVERCRTRGLRVFEGRAVAHGRNIPFLPMLEVFRAYYGIADQDDDRTAREKIAGRLLLIDEEFREVLPLLFDFFGVPDPAQPAPRIDPEASQRQLFGVLRRLVREGGEAEPGVTLLEDLHWMDGGSLAFLEQWVEAIGGARALLLVNFRPEYHAEWMGRSYYQQLPLAPLGPKATRELLADLLGGDPSTDGLAEAIHARTAGNPFFTEEVVQSLIESGQLTGTRGSYRLVSELGALEVPATVQALVAARIDRLPEREKKVLQAAAVIGREFAEPILEAVAELPAADLADSLRALTGAEFLYEQSLYPVAEYVFKHPLTQEVALGSQLGERRRRTHAAVAQAIERASAGKLDERAALLAHHWEEAGEALTAAGWHRRAALWAGSSGLEEAQRHWSRVRALLPSDVTAPEAVALAMEARLRLLNLFWQIGGTSQEECGAVFEEGRALAERLEDKRPLALLVGSGAAALATGVYIRLEDVTERFAEAVRLADRTGDAATRLVSRWRLGYALSLAGRLRDCLSNTEEMVALSEGDWRVGYALVGFSPLVVALFYRRAALTLKGRLEEARQVQQQTVELARQMARETGEREPLEMVRAGLVYLAGMSGDAEEEVVAATRRAAEAAEKYGSSFTRVWAYVALAWAHVQRAAWDDAISAARSAQSLAREKQTGLDHEAEWLSALSEARLGRGDRDEARSLAEQAVASARGQGARIMEIRARLALSRALLASEQQAAEGAVAENLDAAIASIESTGAEGYRPFFLVERAKLARLRGDQTTLERELREAHRLYTEMGATGHAARLAEELGL